VYSDKIPSAPDATVSVRVPIDPVIPSLRRDSKRYLERIREVRRKNKGEWLVPVGAFANEIADATAALTLRLVEVSLAFEGKA